MEDRVNPLLVICGPTASGKTSLSINLCKRLGGEIISADSMQIYKGLNIGTAKPSIEEQQGISHHLLDFLSPEKKYSVADYVEHAGAVISEIYSRGKVPVVCGGTGQYISGIIDGLKYIDVKTNDELRQQLAKREEKEGIEALYKELIGLDPEFAKNVHQNNKKRVLRALELYYQTGITMTQQNKESRPDKKPYKHLVVALNFENRANLYDRINKRVDLMLRQGLLQEAEEVYKHQDVYITAVQAIGYKEFFPYFEGIDSLQSCCDKLKQASRNYAKRQLTWFKRIDGVQWVNADDKNLTENVMALWEKHNEQK